MPRDLESEHQTIQGLAPLARADDPLADGTTPPIIQSPEAMDQSEEPRDRMQRNLQRNDRRNALHPFTSVISANHVDESVLVEEACFPPDERCSREKFEYRLSTCGELCLGIYTTAYLEPQEPLNEEDDDYEPHPAQFTRSPPLPSSDLLENCPTSKIAPTSNAGDGKPRKRMLLGHIISTQSHNDAIKDSDMEIPTSWHANKKSPNGISGASTDPTSAPPSSETKPTTPSAPAAKGHQPFGATICLHSLAILPQYKGLGLGSALLSAYIERMKSAGGTGRIALLAHDELVPYYEQFGFENAGRSEATFGGGDWNDMVYVFPRPEEPPIQSFVGRSLDADEGW